MRYMTAIPIRVEHHKVDPSELGRWPLPVPKHRERHARRSELRSFSVFMPVQTWPTGKHRYRAYRPNEKNCQDPLTETFSEESV
jgi:hypothetical protein